jgi:cytochrome c oxidase assembly protein subunit 11
MPFRLLPRHRVIIYTVLGIFAMFGFSYLMVPLYTLVCKNLGINGRTSEGPDSVIAGMKPDLSRTIDVEFTATVHGDFPFEFRPLVQHLKVHPGEKKMIYYYAVNKTGHPITVQAIPSIMPDDSAKYFKKTECFCFTQQYFFADEKADMPVYFYISPNVPKRTQAMVLSYTLYDVKQFLRKNEQYYRKGRIDV